MFDLLQRLLSLLFPRFRRNGRLPGQDFQENTSQRSSQASFPFFISCRFPYFFCLLVIFSILTLVINEQQHLPDTSSFPDLLASLGVEFEDAQNEVAHSLILYLRSESHPFTIGIHAMPKISNFNNFRHFVSPFVLFSSTTSETGVCARGLFTHARRALGKGKHYAIFLFKHQNSSNKGGIII